MENRDVGTATKIMRLMTKKGISHTLLAEEIGVTLAIVNKVIWGLEANESLREAIAGRLGFDSWRALKDHKEVINLLKDSRFVALDAVISTLERYEGRSIVLRDARIEGKSLHLKLRFFGERHDGIFIGHL